MIIIIICFYVFPDETMHRICIQGEKSAVRSLKAQVAGFLDGLLDSITPQMIKEVKGQKEYLRTLATMAVSSFLSSQLK